MPEGQLKQTAGFWTALALSIGAVSGTTLFFGASIGAQYSGNLIIPASIILGIIAVYIAAIFGELVALFPKAGGAYEFAKHTYGRFFSFLIGWTAWLVGNISLVVLVVGAVNAVGADLSLPLRIALSLGIILLLNLVAFIGIEAGGMVLIVLSAITIGIVGLATGLGFLRFDFSNLVPFVTHPPVTMLVTLFFTMEAYFGWESASYLAEEIKNPTKNIPRAIIIATGLVAVLSTLAIIATVGFLGWERTAGSASPLAALAAGALGRTGSAVIGAGIFLALVGAAAGMAITMPRLLLSLARDKLFLGQFKAVHPKFNTPHKAVLFQTGALVVFFFMGFGSYQTLLSLLVPLALIMYVFLIAAVPILRKKMPEKERAFTAPLGFWGPLVVVAIFAAMMGVWVLTVPGADILLRLALSLIGIGLPLYLLVELYYDPKAITEFNDLAAYASLVGEKLSSNRGTYTQIFTFLGDVQGKHILEFGCGVGSLTLVLLRAVGTKGRVYATHFSRNYIRITQKRAERAEWEIEDRVFGEIVALHDPEHFRRVHPSIRYVDAVVSVGMLGYIQDMQNVLQELAKILPIGGKICFVEYSDFFHVLPNVEWLASDKMIEKMFRDAGFSVQVVRKRSLLWNRIFLYGIKYSGDLPFI